MNNLLGSHMDSGVAAEFADTEESVVAGID
jgi:hypothetical protein